MNLEQSLRELAEREPGKFVVGRLCMKKINRFHEKNFGGPMPENLTPSEVLKLYEWAKGEVAIAPDGAHPNFMLDTMRLCIAYAEDRRQKAMTGNEYSDWQSTLNTMRGER